MEYIDHIAKTIRICNFLAQAIWGEGKSLNGVV